MQTFMATAIYEAHADGISVTSPEIPGLLSFGKTLAEARSGAVKSAESMILILEQLNDLHKLRSNLKPQAECELEIQPCGEGSGPLFREEVPLNPTLEDILRNQLKRIKGLPPSDLAAS